MLQNDIRCLNASIGGSYQSELFPSHILSLFLLHRLFRYCSENFRSATPTAFISLPEIATPLSPFFQHRSTSWMRIHALTDDPSINQSILLKHPKTILPNYSAKTFYTSLQGRRSGIISASSAKLTRLSDELLLLRTLGYT